MQLFFRTKTYIKIKNNYPFFVFLPLIISSKQICKNETTAYPFLFFMGKSAFYKYCIL